jgi:hypothetical protein
VLSSDAPPGDVAAEIRLPVPHCLVWFAQPATIPGEVIPDAISDHYAHLLAFNAESRPGLRNVEQPALAAFKALDTIRLHPHECLLEGVLLFATTNGTLRDVAVWLVRCPTPNGPSNRFAVLGRTSTAGWGHVVTLLGAMVCFGSWSAATPLTAPPVGAGRSAIRELRKGATKRLEEGGGLLGVRVLDAHHRTAATTTGDGTHASPITHVRRGHFRRVPVGPRSEEGREVRWFPPTIVNPGAEGQERIRVYRLPRPKPNTPTPEVADT